MSGHQPQRPYGPMYNPHLPASPSPSVNFGMQRYPNQPPAYNGYWHGQNPSSGIPFPPSTNAYAHHVNAQSSVPPAFPARVAPTAYGGYPGMPQYSSAPTQFFSAPPSSAFAIAPNSTQPQIISNNAPYETVPHYTPNHPPIQQTIPVVPLIDGGEPTMTKDSSVDLEDGELSSGEQEKSSGSFKEKSMVAHERSTFEAPQSRHEELQDVVDQDETSNGVNSISRSQPQSTEIHKPLQDHAEIAFSIREQARHILQELHSYNIGFEDIARESFDVDLLRELFVEIGLPIPALEEQNHQPKGENVLKEVPPTLNGDHNLPENPSNETQPNSNIEQSTLVTNNVSDTAGASNPDGHAVTSKPDTLAVPTQESNLSKGSVKAPAAKSLDRKEYIARLIAAKIGKPTQSSEGAPETTRAPAETNMTISSEEHLPTNGPEITSATKTDANRTQSPSASGDNQNDISDLETKRKAQTDLALQKMEALRAQKKTQEQQPSDNSGKKDSRPAPLEVEIVDSAPSRPTEGPRQPEGPTPTDGRQTSYFSPVSLKPAFSIPGLFTVAQEVSTDSRNELSEPTKALESIPAVEEGDSTDTGIGPRKRLKAADFMDLPPDNIHKSLGKGEDAEVIIEISDDEMENPEDELGPHTFKKTSQPSTITASRREIQGSVFASPPDSNTPGRFQEPQELKMKESEIESMNRKILELEQRIKAKQAASRVQSPRAPIQSTSSSAIASEPKQSSNLALQRSESATEEQLVREKETQEDKLATAEAEHQQIVNRDDQHSLRSPLHSRGSDEGSSHEPLPPHSQSGKDRSSPDLTNRVTKSIDQQKIKLQDELSTLDTDIANSEEEVQIAKLDMERLNEKLDLAKLDMERLRSDLQIKVERRQLLQQQIVDLPRSVFTNQESQYAPNDAIEIDQLRENEDSEVNAIPDISEGLQIQPATVNENALPPTQLTHLETRTQNQQPDYAIGPEVTESALEAASVSARRVSPSTHFNSIDHSSDGEIEEDVMDISGSDVDDGELLESRRESTSKQEEDMDMGDDDDDYEPPSDIGSIQPPADYIDPQQAAFYPDLEPSTVDAPPGSSGEQIDKEMPDETFVAQIQHEHGAKQRLDEASLRDDPKDEDDYEPPEPESSDLRDADPIARTSPVHEMTSDGPAEASFKEDGLTNETTLEGEHFTPYESPLKQFSSYRFHPGFRNEVSGGYRSLTYSNEIKPDVEICQYELSGGVCNDESCTSQHFEKMMLPDHIILSAMGKGEGTTPEEKDNYIKGLKDLILDLRERKIKDLDAIAEAIAQYRLRFLNDSSRVLPL